MYATSTPAVSTSAVNGMGPDIDGSGTINPAALNNSAPLSSNPLPVAASAPRSTENPPSSSAVDYAVGPRGVKRSRDEDQFATPGEDVEVEEIPDDHAPRKRGRPPKVPRPSVAVAATASSSSHRSTKAAQPQPPPHTPQLTSQSLPHASPSATSPTQASPPAKTTPKSVIKALPTVRDHTTDQLDEEGDEYIPKERDLSGEQKVDENGYLKSGRTYKCRTFRVQSRGNKLFMLATECARVLGYRDSYLLFNKNRSLHKIIASQAEKDDLIQQDILPYSYRSRQIAIVTARSMFRQFGSRVIVNGRRVRDDYWESKARKQGFTEEDLAGEKRPGAAKARDAAAAAAEAANAGALPTLGHNDVVYSNEPPGDGTMPPHPYHPGFGPLPSSLAPLPMINPAPSDDPRMREYSSFPRTRQEMAGQPYQDRTQPSTAADILKQAADSADFSKVLNQQRGFRSKGLDDHWHRPREPAQSGTQEVSTASLSGQADSTATSTLPQTLHQRQDLGPGTMLPSAVAQSQNMLQHHQQQQLHAAHPQAAYQQQSAHPQPPVGQPPLRSMSQTIRPDQLHHRAPGMNVAAAGGARAYSYPQAQQLWGHPPHQPQPSPLGMPQYAPQLHAQQQSPSPHLQQTPPHHPSQSPRHQGRPVPSPQLHPQAQQQGMTPVGYPGTTAAAYGGLSAATVMYSQSPGHPGQQYLPGGTQPVASMGMGMGTNASLPGWPSTAGGPLQPGQPPAGSPQGGWPTNY